MKINDTCIYCGAPNIIRKFDLNYVYFRCKKCNETWVERYKIEDSSHSRHTRKRRKI